MKEKVIQTLVRLLEKNGLDDGVRFAVLGHKPIRHCRVINELLEFMKSCEITDGVQAILVKKAEARPPLPYKLHYTDGYESWHLEKSKKVDGFFYGGFLISINHTSTVGNFDEAIKKCAKVKLNGKSCQPLPADVCRKLYDDYLKSVNVFLGSLGGCSFSGIVWTQSVGYTFNFDTGKVVKYDPKKCELHARPAIKLDVVE